MKRNETEVNSTAPRLIATGFIVSYMHCIEGSETHFKSRTGCQKFCEIFESLLIFKSEIFYNLYDIPYIYGYKSVNPASRVPIDS